jgi:hypothetical protein
VCSQGEQFQKCEHERRYKVTHQTRLANLRQPKV